MSLPLRTGLGLRIRRTVDLAPAIAIPWLTALAMTAAPSPAQAAPSAADKQEAQRRFKHGVELFKDDDFESAFFEFRSA